MKSIYKTNPRVLYITFEYDGKAIEPNGGAQNTLAIAFKAEIKSDVFLLERGGEHDAFSGTLYAHDENPESFLKSNHKVLYTLIKDKRYDILHFLNHGEQVNHIVKYLKKKELNLKMVYSAYTLNQGQDTSHLTCLLAEVDCIHVPTMSMARSLSQTYPQILGAKPIVVVPYGVDTSLYPQPASFEIEALKNNLELREDILLLCELGDDAPNNLEVLNNTFSKINEAYEKLKIILVDHKISSSQSFSALHTQSHKDSRDKVMVISPEEVSLSNLLALATVYLKVKTEDDAFAMYAPMILKTPVVALKQPIVEDILIDGVDGFMFSFDDPTQLVHVLMELLGSQERRNQLSQEAYTKIMEKYNWDTVSKMYA
ncbi:MAG TPA: glycosyltransferase, partial [Cytophagales bacterium]|nr:glycosyltransferase [Cytophagales bacterium]